MTSGRDGCLVLTLGLMNSGANGNATTNNYLNLSIALQDAYFSQGMYKENEIKSCNAKETDRRVRSSSFLTDGGWGVVIGPTDWIC